MSLLIFTPQGLFCPAGNFHIDPKGKVEHAVITHAHSDHARRGARQYYCVASGEGLLRARLGPNAAIQTIAYGEKFYFADVAISFHPAGHILGSAQVRLEHRDKVWLVSGDYKREHDPTCEPFEQLTCDVFITEATFGTPRYRWDKNADVGRQIHQWWRENAEAGYNSVLHAYSLGKTQRILGVLFAHAQRPIYCASQARPFNQWYLSQGVELAGHLYLTDLPQNSHLEGELILAPPSFLQSPEAKMLGGRYRSAFASGWTAGATRGYDRGFVLSDHADWDDLLSTITATGARRVYVQHRGKGALVAHLRKLGVEAFADSQLYQEDPQLELF